MYFAQFTLDFQHATHFSRFNTFIPIFGQSFQSLFVNMKLTAEGQRISTDLPSVHFTSSELLAQLWPI